LQEMLTPGQARRYRDQSVAWSALERAGALLRLCEPGADLPTDTGLPLLLPFSRRRSPGRGSSRVPCSPWWRGATRATSRETAGVPGARRVGARAALAVSADGVRGDAALLRALPSAWLLASGAIVFAGLGWRRLQRVTVRATGGHDASQSPDSFALPGPVPESGDAGDAAWFPRQPWHRVASPPHARLGPVV